MKKHLLAFSLTVLGLSVFGQTPRLSLYEEFTGETCPPCAATNPGLNIKLAANYSKCAAIKWQVPIPSAPTKTWSLYQTNKAEIDWRWKSVANGGYGYNINSAPSNKIDGQDAAVFGGASNHPANLTNAVINTAQSYTSAFSITMEREWDPALSSVNLTVNIVATANFNAVGNLVFRTVMVERLIQFSVQPGTNGEKDFEDVAIKSFPTLQGGVAMQSNWTVGQTQTFTLNCPLPSYTRKKDQVAFVGFIQDDGNRKVAQAVRAEKQGIGQNDAQAVAIKGLDGLICGNTLTPEIVIRNNGANTITGFKVTPYVDGVAQAPVTWNGNLNNGASMTMTLSPFSHNVSGSHIFSYSISDVSGTDANTQNNTFSGTFYAAAGYDGTPISEGFVSYPPANWGIMNPDAGITWQAATVGAYNLSSESAMYNCFSNTSKGDKDDLLLPPMDLSGSAAPDMSFDVAYAQRNANSNDQLEVYASDDCGVTWTSVYDYKGAALATAPEYNSSFVPDVAEWRSESITLPGFNKPNVLVKFVVTNDNGNIIYLDNVNLSQSSPVGIAKNTSSSSNISIYPNPSSGITYVRIKTETASEAKVTVLNAIGQVTDVRTNPLAAGTNTVQLDMKQYPAGMYHVLISTADGTVVKKVNLVK